MGNMDKMFGKFTPGRSYKITGYISTPKDSGAPVVSINGVAIFEGIDNGELQFFEIYHIAENENIDINAYSKKYVDFDNLRVDEAMIDGDMEDETSSVWGTIPLDEIVSAQPFTDINKEHKDKLFNIGDDWPRVCKNKKFDDPYIYDGIKEINFDPAKQKEDDHEGMIYNEYTGKWSWL